MDLLKLALQGNSRDAVRLQAARLSAVLPGLGFFGLVPLPKASVLGPQ